MIATIEHTDEADLYSKLANILRMKGWIVLESVTMETPAQVGERFGLAPNVLTMRLKRFLGQFPARTGPSGRILNLHVTTELDAWLLKPMQKR